MFKKGDIVKITVKYPEGVTRTPVEGKIGIITNIEEDKGEEIVYEVLSNVGFYYFVEAELVLATVGEKEKQLREMMYTFYN